MNKNSNTMPTLILQILQDCKDNNRWLVGIGQVDLIYILEILKQAECSYIQYNTISEKEHFIKAVMILHTNSSRTLNENTDTRCQECNKG